MAIKVIGQDGSAAKKVTCKNCGAQLEYYPVDVKEGTETDYTGSRDTYYYIECPQAHCKNRVHVRG